jgi:hypothetical protein
VGEKFSRFIEESSKKEVDISLLGSSVFERLVFVELLVEKSSMFSPTRGIVHEAENIIKTDSVGSRSTYIENNSR